MEMRKQGSVSLLGLFRRLKHNMARGFSVRLLSFKVTLRINRSLVDAIDSQESNKLEVFYLRQTQFLREKYPELFRMKLSLSGDTAERIFQLFMEIIPALDEQAKEVCIRNALHRFRLDVNNSKLASEATREIACSDLRSGMPDRAFLLKDDPSFEHELESQLRHSDESYGAPLLGYSWPDASRGRSLCYYFDNHIEMLKGKRVLHFSPEPELRSWMINHAEELCFSYRTSDITGTDVDIHQDLTALGPQEMYDIVIFHRVLEHVLDDRKALDQLFNIVRPGGVLQISAPQSMHQDHTKEWIVPDLTHHQHVRHYGSDFLQRLTDARFDVQEDVWLLAQPPEQLISNGSYPLQNVQGTSTIPIM